jgi:hypothetical protein
MSKALNVLIVLSTAYSVIGCIFFWNDINVAAFVLNCVSIYSKLSTDKRNRRIIELTDHPSYVRPSIKTRLN